MGCGTIDWVDAFDHALGLLEDDEDAEVREHLTSCDVCRAESGDLKILADRMRALGGLTHLKGREAFADRTRDAVRKAMGGSVVRSQTSAWRIANTGESQRIMRAAVRKRQAAARALKVVAAVVLIAGGGVALGWHLLGDDLVDRYGDSVERAFGVELAAWGLRPEAEDVAAAAGRAATGDELRRVSPHIERLVRRELFASSPRAGAVVLFEFAGNIAREGGTVADARLAAAAVERAAGMAAVADTGTEADADEMSLVRKARALWLGGEADRAREALLLSTVEGSALALYYSALAGAGERAGGEGTGAAAGAGESGEALAKAAGILPAIWAEVAWRRSRAGKPDAAREALARVPDGALKQALVSCLGSGR